MASVAVGSAGLTLVFGLCAWMMLGGEPAYVGVHASAVLPASAPATRVASLDNDTFESRWAIEPPTITASFDDRFPTASASTFDNRFTGTLGPGPRPAEFTLASAPATVRAAPAPAPRAATRALVARAAPKPAERPAAAPYRVASLGPAPIRTAYASADAGNRDAAIVDTLLRKITRQEPATAPAPPPAADTGTKPEMSHTAIYDITAHMVYLPNGTRLEAHSGLGDKMDDLGSVNLRNLGPTPPGIYDLTMREASFHGVDAIRLTPVDSGKMHGRDGILAHPYMLGPNGESNGCVSLKDYDAFLAAFRRGEFNRLMVVERLDEAPAGQTATGWFTDRLRRLFGRS
jgi:hypothetical protein